MSGYRDSGGGNTSLGSGLGAAVGGIANAAKSYKPAKKKSSGSGVKNTVNYGKSAVSNIGKSVANSYPKKSSGYSNKSYSKPVNSGYHPAQPPRVVAPRPPVGNTPTGQIAKAVPAPPPPLSPDDYVAKDTTYLNQKSAYQKALGDYAEQMKNEQSKYTGEFDAQTKQLGLDRQQGATNLADDYASRGLIQSGVYGDALGDFNKKYDTQLSNLTRAKSAYMDDLTTGQTNFGVTQKTMLDKAYQDALNRRLDSLKM